MAQLPPRRTTSQRQPENPPVINPKTSPRPSRRFSPQDRFSVEIANWILVFEILFHVSLIIAVGGAIYGIAKFHFVSRDFTATAFASVTLLVSAVWSWVAFRYSMLGLRFMQANVDALREIARNVREQK